MKYVTRLRATNLLFYSAISLFLFSFSSIPPALLVKVTADESVTVIALPIHLVNRPMKFQFSVTDTMMMMIIIRFFLF